MTNSEKSKTQKKNISPIRRFFGNKGVMTFISSMLCILLGLVVGFIVLLCINKEGAWDAITSMVKNFLCYSKPEKRLQYFGNTLVNTAPLILCSLSVIFAYKTGLFNIGAAGQYVVGMCASLYCALGLSLPWYVCILAAVICAAAWGAISGFLKAFCNVNEVISCIMLNWISLYLANDILKPYVKTGDLHTKELGKFARQAILPSLGLEKLFNSNKYVTIAIPIAIIMAIIVWVILEKTRFGYELKATGFNRNAAKYCGMHEKSNIIITMAISGALAGLGASLLYLTGIDRWVTGSSSVPGMGFDGIAAAFLGGLNPIGTIFSSFFIKNLSLGGSQVDLSVYSSQTADLISSIIIYLCAFVLFFKQFMLRKISGTDKDKKESKATVKTENAKEDK